MPKLAINPKNTNLEGCYAWSSHHKMFHRTYLCCLSLKS
jgi:hypothetical protein